MISPERLELLQGSWVRLVARYGVEPVDAYPPFDLLVAAHSEPHRHYHTLEHLGEMFKVIGKLADLVADPAPLFLATWFHDAVYDPRATDNEARSADLAVRQLSALNLPAETITTVERLIRATQHSEPGPEDPATMVILDADLSILGAEEKRYRRYADAIRREYDFVPEADYREGRRRILTAFLERPRIYRTQRMFEVGEEAARRNLKAERDGLTP
jgi:predicted metal-dependent HD superfamily phosphohydrolase